jgi:capsular exopolysaccharide family
LYLMLLQKREENSISLAATVDKGKLIDEPQFAGVVSPNTQMIYLIALLIGLLLPAFILFLIQFFRYRIEGHEDVARLTKLPIIADVPVASEAAKGKADIVVHENQNNQMEEVFRSMRTNIQFVLEEKQKVVLFTSSTSGEGKTFTAANLAVSFALLGKKVILVGLDIRKPRLAEQFKINDHKHGITNLLMKNEPTLEDLKAQILPSGVNDQLDLLMAGPIPPNPTELIARNSLNTVFDLLRQEYDYVLVDTAPVGLVTDTLQIGKIVDATVYMCRADYTLKSSFDMINELSEQKKLPKMNVVLNGVDMSKKKYGYYYGYGSYGKYGRYGYGKYGKYGIYGNYGSFGNYSNSKYGNKNDNSIKR